MNPSTSSSTLQHSLSTMMSLFVGTAIPAIVLGRGAVGALLLCGLLIAIILRYRDFTCTFRGLFSNTAAILIAATALSWIPSLAYSPDPGGSLEIIVRMLVFLVGAFILYDAYHEDDKHYLQLLKTLVVASLFLFTIATTLLVVRELFDRDIIPNMEWANSFLAFIRGHGWPNGDYDVRLRLKESTSTALLLIPAISWAAYRLPRRWMYLCLVVLAELVASIWLAHNRSSVAGLLAIVLAWGILIAYATRTMRVSGLMLVLLAAVVGGLLWWLLAIRPNYGIVAAGEQSSVPFWLIDLPRQKIWSFAWSAGNVPSWFGVGINMIDQLPNARDWNNISGTRNIPLHPHNWVIEILVETGVIGFTAMLTTIIYSLFSIARGFLKTGCWAFLAALCVAAGYWTNGLFSVSYWSAWWQISFFVTTAICLAGIHRQKPASSHT